MVEYKNNSLVCGIDYYVCNFVTIKYEYSKSCVRG